MELIFIDAKYKKKVKLGNIIKKLPKKIGLITTIQFVDSIKDMKKELENENFEVFISKGIQENYGQLLGCESSAALSINKNVEAYLYVGTGKFHPINVAMQTEKTVFTFNPFTKEFETMDKKHIEKIKSRKTGAMLKYLNSENIGIIVTTKPGQCDFDKAIKLKKKLIKNGKNAFIFMDNTYNLQSLEDFNFIEAWVNTACPRIVEDITCVNINDLI